jgi:hypothetical protein
MPSRNLPTLGIVEAASGITHTTANINANSLPEMNVVQLYEEAGSGGSSYIYGRPREYSGGGRAGFIVVENEATAASKGLHLPAVSSTPSAASNKSRGIGVDAFLSTTSGARNVALSPDSAMQRFAHQMSSYEHREIYSYTSIYFVGPSAVKKSGVAGAPNNDGYDDEQGSYMQVTIYIANLWTKLIFFSMSLLMDSFWQPYNFDQRFGDLRTL